MTIDIRQFFQVFFDEADELLAEKERLLLQIDIDAPDLEDLNAIFRTAHSIKGGASTFGMHDMSEVTHLLESLLERIRNGDMALTAEHVDAFLAAKDILKMQLNGHRHGSAVDQDAVADLRMMLQALSQDALVVVSAPTPSAALGAERRLTIELPPLAPRDVDALVAELGLLGAITLAPLDGERHAVTLCSHHSLDDIVAICAFLLDPDDLIIVEAPAPGADASAERARLEQELGYGFFDPIAPDEGAGAADAAAQSDAQRGYGFFEPIEPIEHSRAAAASAPPSAGAVDGAAAATHQPDARKQAKEQLGSPAGAEAQSIRVSTEKVDQLINLIGELVITQAMIEQRSDGLDPMLHERLLASVSQLTRNTRDLQEAVMSIRMMPMDVVFSRFPRMVRDLAAKLGKKVDFLTSGAATELDKGLIERIIDPLTHLVRNSIDHGIETPAARLACGKAGSGRLLLSACHQGGNIVIEVSDDGAGLNREKILAKAAQNGVPVAEGISDQEVWQLIFAPGFSTVDSVTDVSGRGVGMDVVKRNITAIGGAVQIRSARGFGTTIAIALPLTLAILDGMSIRCGDEVYILPLGFVVESLQPAPGDIHQIAQRGQVITVRGEYLPLIALHQVFGIAPRRADPCQGIVVIVEADGRKAALLVDDLLGQQQVVVKNLESNYRKVAGISGATILGDGAVSLVLDVGALLLSARQQVAGAASPSLP